MTRKLLSLFLLLIAPAAAFAAGWSIAPQARVTSEGVFLSDLIQAAGENNAPKLLLTNAPLFGAHHVLSKAQLLALILQADPSMAEAQISVPAKVVVARKARLLPEAEALHMLAEEIRRAQRLLEGELELKCARPWTPLQVPDEPITLKITELPVAGLSPHFIARFDIVCREEAVASLALALKAQLWDEIYVADGPVMRGQSLREAPLRTERRDLLAFRDGLKEIPLNNPNVEIAENLRSGAPLTSRSLRLRTVVKRGRVLEALLTEQGMKISAKVEALEDGVPGQIVRVRNLRSKRELKGKVHDEQTIHVLF